MFFTHCLRKPQPHHQLNCLPVNADAADLAERLQKRLDVAIESDKDSFWRSELLDPIV